MTREPEKKKIRGSYWPHIPASQMYMITFADGEIIYMGNSYSVARLICACMSPRQ